MNSYLDGVKQSQKEFTSLNKATKQLLQHFGVVVNRLVDLSDLLTSIAKRESNFIRDPLEAMSSVIKTLAAEWSVAIKGISSLPNCFDMKEDTALVQASIKQQAQAQPPFCVQANHELVVNAAVFERTRAANIQQALYNLGHSLLYIGIRAVESGTNLKTLSSIIDPHASVLDVATRFRDLNLGENVTMNMLLKISAEDIKNHLIPQISQKTIKYAGQLNSYKDKRKQRNHSSMFTQGLSQPLQSNLSLTGEKYESNQEIVQNTITGYQNVTINSPTGTTGLPPQHPRPQQQQNPIEHALEEKYEQKMSQQEDEYNRSRQIQEYQQQIIEQQGMISSLQAQLKEQIQIQLQMQQLQQIQTPQTLQILQPQVQGPISSNKPINQGGLQQSTPYIENKITEPIQPTLSHQQRYYSEDDISTSDYTQGTQPAIDTHHQANNPFTKPKTHPQNLLTNDLSNYIQESELTDAHMRESTELSQISMSKRASNALNFMTRSTTELDNMGDEYDLSKPDENITTERTADDHHTTGKEDVVVSNSTDAIDYKDVRPPKIQERAKPKKSTINNFLRDPSAKNKEKTSSKATIGLYSSIKDDDSFGLVNPAPTQPAKQKIDINALDDDLDFF